MEWTTELEDTILDYRKRGYTAQNIAALLVKHHGVVKVSRNAILGKVHRLQAPPKVKKPRVEKKPPVPQGKPIIISNIVRKERIVPEEGISLMELENDSCRFPFGETSYKFCGKLATRGSYCHIHAQKCYVDHGKKK